MRSRNRNSKVKGCEQRESPDVGYKIPGQENPETDVHKMVITKTVISLIELAFKPMTGCGKA